MWDWKGVPSREGLRLGRVLTTGSILHARGADKGERIRQGWPVEEAQIRDQNALAGCALSWMKAYRYVPYLG